MKMFRKIFIGLLIALTAGSAFALDLPIKEINGRQYYYYAVKRGDSLLSIAKELGVSRDDIVKYNPRMSDGVRQGTTIYLPVSDYADVKSPLPTVRFTENRPQEKLERIEEKRDEEWSLLPDDEASANSRANDSTSGRRATIALMLPLMLNDTCETKTSRSATEFVRGFMMGVNEMSNRKIEADIYVYDTQDSSSIVAETMGNVTMDYVDVLVAPDDAKSLQIAAEEFRSPQGYILNMFCVQDSTHFTNPRVVQGNVHNTLMYEKAVDAMFEKFADHTPVFLISKNGKNEKANFTNYVRSRYADAGLPTLDMTFNNMLASTDLVQLDSAARYVFIPASGSLNEFNKFARALRAYRESLPDPSAIALFGYPDWTTFRNEALENLHTLEATIYSRFYADNNRDAREFARNYEYYYGTEMPEQVPSQALLGYDTARHILSAMENNDGCYAPYEQSYGLQSSFSCDGDNEQMAGYSNQAVYIITFKQGENVDVQVR